MPIKNPTGRRGVPSKRVVEGNEELRFRTQFAQRFRQARQALNLTQEQVADQLKVSQGRINGYERGRAVPRTFELPSVCQVIGIDPNALLGFAINPPAHARGNPASRRRDVEIVPMLIASTAHVTHEENKRLSELGFRRDEYGWFLYVGGRGDPVLSEIPVLSEGLTGVVECARKNDCQYVLLDCDADELPGVATYEW